MIEVEAEATLEHHDDAPLIAVPPLPDSGLIALALIARYYRIAADPHSLAHALGLASAAVGNDEVMRGAQSLGLKARIIAEISKRRLFSVPLPALLRRQDGNYTILSQGNRKGVLWETDVVAHKNREVTDEDFQERHIGDLILISRRLGGPGTDPKTFGFFWFLPSIFRYRKALAQVLVASLFVQIFALITPIFFQLIIDKVLVHKAFSTLVVLAIGLAVLGFFETLLQYLRSYMLNHTTNRIDVELGQRLFHHLFRLPLSYFETRAAGQTVARVRELETIRNFLTGQGLTSFLDFAFAILFIGVLFIYSPKLTFIVIGSIPVYVLIATLIRPILRNQLNEKFNRGARSQQFLVESIVGAQTLKAASVEPLIQAQWEDRLAAYVRTSFDATMTSVLGSNLIQYVSKLTTALILFLGAQAVIEGSLTIGELIAFNLIAAQVTQPILRLSQLWQDFQQAQVSVERLGDILNTPGERRPREAVTQAPLTGTIQFDNVVFRYRSDGEDVLKGLSFSIKSGEVIGVVGASGSGKSTIAKLVQRLYSPQSGQILIDGTDVAQMEPSWLRRQIGVVLQENLLFSRGIHDNIALGEPSMSRADVIKVAKLAGAHEFITRLPNGYDTEIEERGANLSGGQRQRIAIARALATNPRILILDEATSALDYESERIIQDNMRAIVRGRTVIIIAHRLAAVRPCNRIIGMQQGRIVEIGSHHELLAQKNGLYAKLWALQSDMARA